jgi:aryl-alcohol dehydrogenase-like predicted oxidoreductase
MFDCFAEAGGNFIDTANLYTNGTSEKYVGDFIALSRSPMEVVRWQSEEC